MKELEIKYDQEIQKNLKKQRETLQQNADKLPKFWLNALSNHKIFKDFINNDDVEVLAHLTGISYEKIDKDNVFFFELIKKKEFQAYFHFF